MIVYVDTSALVKLVVDEPGSDAAASLWRAADTLATVRIASAEARAALAAAERAGRLTPAQHRSAKAHLRGLWSQCAVVEVSEALVVRAGDLAERHGLRGYDAVHLSAAIEVGPDVVASADAALCRAASVHGLHVATTR